MLPKCFEEKKKDLYKKGDKIRSIDDGKKNCNIFQNKITIGLVFDSEQKFHSSSMIFWTFKNPLDKKFFFQAQNFDCHRCRLTLGPKITLEVWFHNREAGGIFLWGYGEKWLKRC